MSDYAKNYYRETVASLTSYPRLTSAETADVCVIGAGLAGLTAALNLAQAGQSVILLEAEQVAWGASGRNGGVVGQGYAAGFDQIAAQVGHENAIRLHQLSIEGVDIVRRNIESFQISSADPVHGVLSVSRFNNSAETRKQVQWMSDTFEQDMEFLPKNKIREGLHTDRYFHAVHDKNAFHFHPLNYANGLARELERLGGAIFEHSRALHISGEKQNRVVETPQGSVKSRHVLITCGGYTDKLVPRLASSYIPISTYMIMTEAAPELIAKAIESRCAIGDTRRSADYYRVVENGKRLLWGGKITTQKREPSHLGELLKKSMIDVYPQLADLKIEQAWSGKMGYARHLMPQIGNLEDGLWYCMSFGGHGMNTTAIGGTIIAEAILKESDRYKFFEPFGLAWNGGVVGKVAVQLTYWSYRASDVFQERKAQKAN